MNYSNIKTDATQYRKSPGEEAWQRLESKLDQPLEVHSNNYLRKTMLYAAVFVGFCFVTFLLYTDNNKTYTPVFDLTIENEPLPPLYSVEKVTSLKYAYAKLSFPQKLKSQRDQQ